MPTFIREFSWCYSYNLAAEPGNKHVLEEHHTPEVSSLGADPFCTDSLSKQQCTELEASLKETKQS
jgi:hypothetical protein